MLKIVQQQQHDVAQHDVAQLEDGRNDVRDARAHRGQHAQQNEDGNEAQLVAHHHKVDKVEKAQHEKQHTQHHIEQQDGVGSDG